MKSEEKWIEAAGAAKTFYFHQDIIKDLIVWHWHPQKLFGGGARSTNGGRVRGSSRGEFRGLSPRTPEKFSKNL